MVAKASLQVYVNRSSGHLIELNASFFLKSVMCGKPKKTKQLLFAISTITRKSYHRTACIAYI